MPPEDPRSLLYMLDSKLEQLELEEELQRRVAEEEERRDAETLLEMMLENDILLDALGRRTLAIGGFEAAPVFYDPFFGYVTRPQSTSQGPPLGIQFKPVPHSTSAHVHLPHENLRAAQQHASNVARSRRNAAPRRPAFYAHELEPKHVRDHYEDHALDWLARELLGASRNSAQSTGNSQAGKTGVSRGSFGDGHVYVIDDGSVGDAADSAWTEDEGEGSIPSYQVEQYEGKQKGSTDVESKALTSLARVLSRRRR